MIVELVRTILTEDATVAGYVGARVYPVQLPDEAQYDALVITKISGRPEYDMAGEAGVDGSRLQVDVHTDKGASHCIALKKAVRAALSAYRGSPESGEACQIQAIFCINDFDLTEPATERAGPRVRRRTLEFNIFSREV